MRRGGIQHLLGEQEKLFPSSMLVRQKELAWAIELTNLGPKGQGQGPSQRRGIKEKQGLAS